MNFEKYIEKKDLNLPATEEQLKEAEIKLGICFPAGYREFMLSSNGAEGKVGKNAYLAIWTIEEVIEINLENIGDKTLFLNDESQEAVIIFGSDGGGEAYAFDKKTEDASIIAFPFISNIREEAKVCGTTFIEFLRYLYEAEE